MTAGHPAGSPVVSCIVRAIFLFNVDNPSSRNRRCLYVWPRDLLYPSNLIQMLSAMVSFLSFSFEHITDGIAPLKVQQPVHFSELKHNKVLDIPQKRRCKIAFDKGETIVTSLTIASNVEALAGIFKKICVEVFILFLSINNS